MRRLLTGLIVFAVPGVVLAQGAPAGGQQPPPPLTGAGRPPPPQGGRPVPGARPPGAGSVLRPVPAATADPMAFASDLAFVAMVGIIDPLRVEAKGAVQVALRAGAGRLTAAQSVSGRMDLGPVAAPTGTGPSAVVWRRR